MNKSTTSSSIPCHVAVIMDGNGRWARQRYLPRSAGHKAGIKSLHAIIKFCGEKGISILTLFAFGRENWRRPQEEINSLFSLFLHTLSNELNNLHKRNVQLRIIGDNQQVPIKLRNKIQAAEQLTKNNTGLKLVVAMDYSGQWDILQATKRIALAVKQNKLACEDINETVFQRYLSTVDIPAPDLFIRTSGELRISNFLLWQLAYTEFYFTDTLWPDFDHDNMQQALDAYAQRTRKFGYTDEQLKEEAHA